MKNGILVFLLTIFISLLSACSNEVTHNSTTEEDVTTTTEDKYAYITEDSMYYISRHGKLLKREWNVINELSEEYDNPRQYLYDVDYYVDSITNYLDIEDTWYVPYQQKYSDYQIQIKTTNGGSETAGGYWIYLYLDLLIKINKTTIDYGIPPLTHELTHILTPFYSSLTFREGLACYMQDKFGKNSSLFNFGAPIHQLVKEFLYEESVIEVIGTEGIPEETYYRTYRTVYYLLSYSFSKYLIEQYGIEDFMIIYNSDNLYNDYVNVYGKDLVTLKSDWITYLDTLEPYELTYEELMNRYFSNN